MTDEQFNTASRNIAALVAGHGKAQGLSGDEVCNLAGAALAEVLAMHLDPFGAVERLRTIADHLEMQIMGDVRVG